MMAVIMDSPFESGAEIVKVDGVQSSMDRIQLEKASNPTNTRAEVRA